MSPERTTNAQLVQIGIETTPGTLVAANKRLQALGIEPNIDADVDVYRPSGQKLPAISTVMREMASADLSGRATYSEMIYPLASLLTNPTVAQIMDGATPTGAYRWTFTPSSTLEDTPKALTVEYGSAVRAHRFGYGLVNEFGITFARGEAVELSGSMIGRRLEDAITLTPAPTLVELVPIFPQQVDVFFDSSAANIGTTKLGRVKRVEWTVSDRYTGHEVLDSAQPSLAFHTEAAGDEGLPVNTTIVLAADSAGMTRLQNMRDGELKFIRIQAVGSQIYAPTPVNYQLRIDQAVRIASPEGFSDEDGLYSVGWGFRAFHDAGWGKALTVELINKIAAL